MKKIIVLSLVFIVITLIISIILKIKWAENNYIKTGEDVINMIELYRKNTGKLPENLYELNYSENMQEGPHYLRINSISYQVFYSLDFDDYFVYDSREKVWKKTN